MSLYLVLRAYVSSLLRREEGQDLVEYGLLVVLIAVVVAVAVGVFGGQINTFFSGLWANITSN